jgi:hypothetical protein
MEEVQEGVREEEIVRIISDEGYSGDLPQELRDRLRESIIHNKGLMARLAKL